MNDKQRETVMLKRDSFWWYLITKYGAIFHRNVYVSLWKIKIRFKSCENVAEACRYYVTFVVKSTEKAEASSWVRVSCTIQCPVPIYQLRDNSIQAVVCRCCRVVVGYQCRSAYCRTWINLSRAPRIPGRLMDGVHGTGSCMDILDRNTYGQQLDICERRFHQE